MSFEKHSTNTSHSNQEEYSYHLDQSIYHVECAQKAQLEKETHMGKFQEHLSLMQKIINNFSL